jgi:3-oxoadipate enol-lactonase
MASFLTSDKAVLHYETFGFDIHHPALVFLNGTAQTTQVWRAFAKRLQKYFRILLYDARTQGQSRMGSEAPLLERHADDLSELMAHLSIPRAHLAGFSHGAAVALAVAAKQPQLVDRLVLCCPAYRSGIRYEATLENWIQSLEKNGLEAFAQDQVKVAFSNAFLEKHPDVTRNIIESIVQNHNKESLLAQLKAMAVYPPPSDFPPITPLPVLLISAGRDPFLNKEEAKKLSARHSTEHLHFKDLGHAVPLEAPTAFLKALTRFLGEPLGD